MTWRTWRRKRIGVAGVAGLIFVTTVAGCSPPPPPPPSPPPRVEEEIARPVFTQRQFGTILYDMTYGQVSEILGAESTRQESTYDEGESEYVQPSLTSWYYWENEDGSFIKAGFVDKKLIEKFAENLPQ